ncbi:MAG: type II/IV secretion system protein [Elusimicrobia bacterium]|nr:type II/IV secretion system protein [Elusimicrobiota bacterium]
MPSLSVYWNRCAGDTWAELYAVDLNDPHFDGLEGVYMVWMGGNQPAAICAGAGLIREKLAARREEPAIAAMKEKSLLVTWAKVDAISRGGVERWLLENLRPKVANPLPGSVAVEVNLPGRPGAAKPDAGEGPKQSFEDLLHPPAAPPAVPTAGPKMAEAPPPQPEARATPAPTENMALRLPLQPAFADLLAKAKASKSGGGLFGGSKPKPEEEKLVSDVVQMILRNAARLKASDVHMEPLEASLRVRFRVDGILEEVLQIPNIYNLRAVSHIRVMCGLDPERGIGTSRPEDGRMAFAQDGMEADLRLSTFPTSYGDKAVLRLIPRSTKVPPIDDLGLAQKTVDALRALTTRPQGMLIVTGPTGSGKSTTLYTLLQSINTPGRNIVTLEDPIEKKIPGINQGMIQPKAGFGFAEGLRAILRQDPNVIMVGEIRDLETAEIAVSASLTGHMIFTTLHTNSALGAITRLFDMELEPFLIASAVTAVSAQRLARRVCTACVQPYEATAEESAEIENRVLKAGIKFPQGLMQGLKRGAGCDACRGSGYQGRVLLFEFVAITPPLRQLILRKAAIDELRIASVKEGMEPMILDGFRKAGAGLTTIAEVFRVVDSID